MAAWDRVRKETDKAFLAFSIYRDMGSERSIDKAHEVYLISRELGGNDFIQEALELWRSSRDHQEIIKRSSKRPRHWLAWSSRHDWANRTNDYDKHLDGLVQQVREEAISERIRRIGLLRAQRDQLADKLLQKIDKMAAFPLSERQTADGKTIVKPAKWSFSTINTLIGAVDRLVPALAQGEQNEQESQASLDANLYADLSDAELNDEIQRMEQRGEGALSLAFA